MCDSYFGRDPWSACQHIKYFKYFHFSLNKNYLLYLLLNNSEFRSKICSISGLEPNISLNLERGKVWCQNGQPGRSLSEYDLLYPGGLVRMLPVVPVALTVAAAPHAHPLPALIPVHIARLPELPRPCEAPEPVPGGNGADLLAEQLSRHKPADSLPSLLLTLQRRLGPK